MLTIIDTRLDRLYEAENQLRINKCWLANLLSQHAELRAFVKHWTEPYHEFRWHVARADAIFRVMNWDQINAFAEAHPQECLDSPWHFMCMLDHLSERLSKRVLALHVIHQHLLKTVIELITKLEDEDEDFEDIEDIEDFDYDGDDVEAIAREKVVVDRTFQFTTDVLEMLSALAKHLKNAIGLVHRLERDGIA